MTTARIITLAVIAGLFGSGSALAQGWTPGSEIIGQSVQVEANGVINTIAFQSDGTATIVTPAGRSVPATWSATNGQMCLSSAGSQECWPYTRAFQAGQPMSMTSSCNATSRWVASGINMPPQSRPAGERG